MPSPTAGSAARSGPCSRAGEDGGVLLSFASFSFDEEEDDDFLDVARARAMAIQGNE
jgi:hypothetical protein